MEGAVAVFWVTAPRILMWGCRSALESMNHDS